MAPGVSRRVLAVVVAAGAVVMIGLVAVRERAEPAGSHGADPSEVEAVELDVEEIRADRPRLRAPVGVGDVLVVDAGRGETQGDGEELVRSTDLGATWSIVDLPGRPEVVDLELHRVDDALAVVGELRDDSAAAHDLGDAVYLWLSSDGLHWQGGRIAVPRPTGDRASVRQVTRLDDGALMATIDLADDEERVVRSDDGARTWRPAPCPEPNRTSEGCRRPYEPERVGPLWIRDDPRERAAEPEWSTDQGRTWRRPELPGVGGRFTRLDAVELRGGGWLVLATTEHTGNDEIETRNHLFRLDEDLRGQRVLDPDPRCRSASSEVTSPPVALGDRWLVRSTCSNPDDGPVRSLVYQLDPDGRDPRLVAGTETDAAHYQEPIVLDDVVLLPVADFTSGATTSLLRFHS